MINKLDNQDGSPHMHMNISETGEEAQDKGLALDDDLEFDADNIKIEEGDHIFMAMVYPVDPFHSCFEHGVWTYGRGFCKELKAKGVP
jgi:hypothetical protein